MKIFTILYLLCGFIYIYLGVFTFSNDSKNKLNKIFLVTCLTLACWAFMFSLENNSGNAQTAREFYIYSIFSWSVVHCMILQFIIVLTGKDGFFKRRWVYAFFYFPAFFSIYLYAGQPPSLGNFIKTNLGWFHFMETGRGFVWTNFFNAYYVAYMAAIVILLAMWWRNSEIKRERKQARLILSTFLLAITTGGITDIVLPKLGMPLIPAIGIVIVIVPMVGIWYSIKRYKLMDLNPDHFGLEILKIMNEGLMIVNDKGMIKYVNNGGLKLLGYSREQLTNKFISSVFPESLDILKLRSCSSVEIEMLQNNKNKLTVLLSSSVLQDEWGDSLGVVGIFQNISEIKQFQRELLQSYDELEVKVMERTCDLRKANADLEQEIDIRIAMEQKIKNLAYYDHLTGLPNRRLFNDRLNQVILGAIRKEESFGVLFLDLDSFKRVNDTMGHGKGDELLKMVSERLSSQLRESDTISRVGGDEFLILISNLEDQHYIRNISDKLLTLFKDPFVIDSHDLYITTSIGGSIYPIDGLDVETLIKNADIAMYRAKEKGRNNFELCSSITKNKMAKEMKLTNSLYRALERNELELYYQPQVNIKSGEIIGLEALIRWNNSEMGRVNPGDFIYIAEKTGLILPIGEWVIRSACIQNKRWQDEGILDVPVAINLSVSQFQNSKIVEQINGILREVDLDPAKLELEITENVIMKEPVQIIDALTQLKKLGIKIAIDDFGTEYSSLNYIKQLPLDRIKIDMSFVQGIHINHKDESIIKVIVVLARNLGLNVIAEGVETLEQLDFLRDQMCDDIQGYYFYKPMPAYQIEELMREKAFSGLERPVCSYNVGAAEILI